jgi:outer membrane protein assembly factor BamB
MIGGRGRYPRRARALLALTGALALTCTLLAVGSGSASAAGSGIAVTYQVDVAHDGVQTDPSLSGHLVRRWTATLPGPTSYPLIAGGSVFVTAADAGAYGTTLYALAQTDGHVLWSQSLGGTYWWSAAAYDGGRVFVVNFDGLLRAFTAGTGALAWSVQLPGQYAFTSAPTASNGVVYVGGAGSGGTLYAVSQATGQVLATRSVMNGDESSPALGGGGVFVSYACNQAYGFAESSLTPLWHYSTSCEGGGGKTPVYANGRVFTRDWNGNLVLDAATGSLTGTFGTTAGTPPAPAVDGNTMWLLEAGTLRALDVVSGVATWSFAGDGQLQSAPLVVSTAQGKVVFIGSASGLLYALDAATGSVLSSTNVGAAILRPDEQNVSQPLTGLGAGQGLLVVPAGSKVVGYAADTTAPTITAPSVVTAAATSSNGANVTFTVTATDPDDAAAVSCSPASGSLFAVGTTTVGCLATDTAGNTTSTSFPVVVSAPGADCNLAHYPRAKGALNLKGANLSGCYLPGADLAKASATSANLLGVYLAGADLTSADLSRAILRRAVLTNANLTRAKLNAADLTGANLTGAAVSGVSWSQAICPDGTTAASHGNTCAGHL